MSVLQIAIIGIAGALLAILFQRDHKEYTIVIGIIVAIIIFGAIMSQVGIVVDTINEIQSFLKMEVAYIQVILKMLGITYIAEFASNICKDSGYSNVATQIELFAKVSILALSMPILLALLETIKLFLS